MLAEMVQLLTLSAGYNTTLVLIGASVLGAGSGLVGCYAFLRRRSLISEAVATCTLPGVVAGALVATAVVGTGRHMGFLMAGAGLFGLLAILAVQAIRDGTRLKEDTAIAIVLSVGFALGMTLLSYVQYQPDSGQARLSQFLLGAVAGMQRRELQVLMGGTAAVALVAVALFKEFKLVCFDPQFAAAQGWSVTRYDLIMMGLLLVILALGLRLVGAVLIVALVIVPPVAARFWTQRLGRMMVLAALVGGLSGYLGAAISALVPDQPAGATIVVTAGAIFMISFLAAPKRGLLAAGARHIVGAIRLGRRQALAHLTRDTEAAPALPAATHWLLYLAGDMTGGGALTRRGERRAQAALRQQRLWAAYLRDFPDEALAGGVSASAPIDQVLSATRIAELEAHSPGPGSASA